jgi:type IX secretion system PorP/SprF family membrane protein
VRVRYDHLRVGFQAGIISKTLNTQDLVFEDQFDGINDFTGTTNEDVQRYTLVVPDVSMGLLWYRTQKIRGNPEIMPYIGASFQHINRPRIGFVVRGSERNSMRYTGQIGARFTTRTAFEFNVNTVLAYQNQSFQATINAFTRVVLFENGVLFGRHKASVLGGVVWRTSDAINAYLGFEFEKYMMLGMAYDFYYGRDQQDPFTRNAFGGMHIMYTYLIGHKLFREPSLPFPFF